MGKNTREYCDCSRRATIGKGDAAICEYCHGIQEWLKSVNFLHTHILTEEQHQKQVQRIKENHRRKYHTYEKEFHRMIEKPANGPPPPAPPNTLFCIEGFKHYFIVDRHAA